MVSLFILLSVQLGTGNIRGTEGALMDSWGANQAPSQEETVFPPLSPISEVFSTTILPLHIIVVFEIETKATDEQIIQFSNKILNFNIRFSSVIDIDNKRTRRWKKTDVRVENHIVVPTFPKGLSQTDYEKQFHEYLSKIAFEPFPEGRPLWDFHVIKYPRRHGAMAGVLRFDHAIGDGYSLLSLACHVFERADDPSLPLSLPSLSFKSKGVKQSFLGFTSQCLNSIGDLCWLISKATVLKDHPSAIRSMKPTVGKEPMDVSSITLSLEQVKQIKSKVNGTVNDVITGLIYNAIHLYMQKMGQDSSATRMTSKVMFNTRSLKGYKNVDEMLKGNIWGNHAGFLQIQIPTFTNMDNVHPLSFITKAKENGDRMKNTLLGYLMFQIMNSFKWVLGTEKMAKFAHSGFKNTSISITNVIGPNDKMAFMGHPINNFYFFVTGIPQSLIFNVISYMGQIKVTTVTEKNFIDSEFFVCCMNEAFRITLEAICAKGLKE